MRGKCYFLNSSGTSIYNSSEGNTNADSELKHAMITDEDFSCQQKSGY